LTVVAQSVHGINYIKQTEKHTAVLLLPQPSSFEVWITIEKLKRCKSPGTDQKIIQAGGNTLCYEIHKLITCIWNKEELPEQWKVSIIVPIPIYKDDKTYVDEITGDHQCAF
jgi:hypothetical protein